MPKKSIICLALVAIFSAGSGVAAGYAIGISNQEQEVVRQDARLPTQQLAATSPPALWREYFPKAEPVKEAESAKPRYLLGTDHGFVAVFSISDSNTQVLIERTSTPEIALSPEERKRLENGIFIYTEEQLVKALQDYGS